MKRLILLLALFILPSLADAATTYYVRTGGSNSHACSSTNDDAHAKQTVGGGLACLSAGAGDTLIIDDGSYAEGIALNAIPSGADYLHPTLVKAANRGAVTLTALNADSAVIMVEHKNYITIDGINADASGTATATPGVVVLGGDGATPSNGSSYLVYQYGEIIGNIGSGCLGSHGYPSGNSTHITVSHATIHNCGYGSGNTTIHALYVNWADSLIEYSTAYNTDGSCFLIFSSDSTYNASNDTVNANLAYNCGNVPLRSGSGTGQIWSNNRAYSGGAVIGGSAGVWVNDTNGGTEYIYNNTIYNNTGKCIHSAEAAGTIVAKNNICWLNSNNIIDGNGGTVTQTNNICGTSCASSANPSFVNAPSNFRVYPSSYAVGNAVDLSSSGVPTDADGLTRTVPNTIGAFITTGSNTYYTATTGNNSNTCTQAKSISTPKLTISGGSGGKSCLSSGDTLIIEDGTYAEGIEYNDIPAGVDDSNHTVVRAENIGGAIVNGVNGDGFTVSISGAYITVSGLVINAVSSYNGVAIYLWGTTPVKANHILLQDLEVKNVTGGTSACITAGGDGTDVHHITMRRLNVHDCVGGTPTTHGIYLHMNDSTVEDTLIYNIAGYGIQQYSNVAVALSNNTIQRNTIHDVAQDGTSYGGIYLGQTNSTDTFVINNVIYNGGGHGSCVQIQGTISTTFSNNTCSGFVAAGGITGCIREGISGADLTSVAQNNICWNNSPLNTIVGTSWTQNHNICGSGCASSSDPLFVNEAGGNLHLSAGSPAIDAGATIGTITSDIEGNLRPQGSAYDIGAYERVSTSSGGSSPIFASKVIR